MNWIKANVLQVICILLAGLLLAQTGRLMREQTAHAKFRTAVAERETARTQAALKHEVAVGLKEFAHAAATQENTDAFTTSQPVRDAIARADAARSKRLLDGAESRAATARAMAEAGAAACRDLADRYNTLDAHVVRGVGVVAGLRETVIRRDAEVGLLRRQIDIDRALLEGGPVGQPER